MEDKIKHRFKKLLEMFIDGQQIDIDGSRYAFSIDDKLGIIQFYKNGNYQNNLLLVGGDTIDWIKNLAKIITNEEFFVACANYALVKNRC